MQAMSKWAPSPIEIADSKEKILALLGEGYRLCVEPDCCFMDEGFRHIGQDRARIPVTREAADAALADKTRYNALRVMTDEEVREKIQVDPRNRKFYLTVM